MTVKELLKVFPYLEEVSFIRDMCVIEVIDCTEEGSWREIAKHYGETVNRVFAIAEDKIRIDSK